MNFFKFVWNVLKGKMYKNYYRTLGNIFHLNQVVTTNKQSNIILSDLFYCLASFLKHFIMILIDLPASIDVTKQYGHITFLAIYRRF